MLCFDTDPQGANPTRLSSHHLSSLVSLCCSLWKQIFQLTTSLNACHVAFLGRFFCLLSFSLRAAVLTSARTAALDVGRARARVLGAVKGGGKAGAKSSRRRVTCFGSRAPSCETKSSSQEGSASKSWRGEGKSCGQGQRRCKKKKKLQLAATVAPDWQECTLSGHLR